MRLYDAHNHLQDERLAPHLDAILPALASVGITRMVVNGSCEEDWPAVLALAQRDARVLPSFGYHPWYVHERTANWQAELLRCLDAVPSAIGEIGLDKWILERAPLARPSANVPNSKAPAIQISLSPSEAERDQGRGAGAELVPNTANPHHPRKPAPHPGPLPFRRGEGEAIAPLAEQEEVFIWQLRLAAQRNLPVSIHCLQAWGAMLEILQREPRPRCGFVLHSYGGPREMVAPLARLGAYFSLPGYFAHERKQRQRDAFLAVPPDRLLIETDAPDQLLPDARNHHPLTDASTGRT